MNIIIKYFLKLNLAFVLSLFLISSSCNKDDNNNNNNNNNCIHATPRVPDLSAYLISCITDSSAYAGANILFDGCSEIIEKGVCYSIHEYPTIEDEVITCDSNADSFRIMLAALSPGTQYYIRTFATNSTGTGYGHIQSIITPIYGTFTDSRDNNVYKTIIIGNQVWMAENLKYLPFVSGPESGSLTMPHFYVYNYLGMNVNDAMNTINYNTYGVLYNWAAAMNGSASSSVNPSGVQGVCPEGWHLPSDNEFRQLMIFIGNSFIENNNVKKYDYWDEPCTHKTNRSGFSAVPAGERTNNGTFSNLGILRIGKLQLKVEA